MVALRRRSRLRGTLACGGVAAALVALAWVVPPYVFLAKPAEAEVLCYDDGLYATSGVIKHPHIPIPLLHIHGETFPIFGSDDRVDVPLALHPAPRRMLILAFATGHNPAKAIEEPRFTELHAVDLNGALMEINRRFGVHGTRLHENELFTYFTNDGRNHLATTS